MRKLLFPLVLGLAGCAMLISLGLWQVDRLAWKQGIIQNIDTRLGADPVPLLLDVTEAGDEYRRVTLTGTTTGEELHVLTSGTAAGTGYRVVGKFILAGGAAILLDQGLLAIDQKDAPPVVQQMQVSGTLLWPDDQNNSTPDPDLAENIWFARDIPAMAAILQTEPLLVVVTQTMPVDPRLAWLPVNTVDVTNDHFEYAITWFLLAFVWGIMSLYLIVRTIRPKDS